MSARAARPLGLLGALVALLLACLPATRAEAVVYWGANGFIGAANTDGTMLVGSYPNENANQIPRAHITGVAVNSTHLLWSDVGNRTIGSMALVNTPDGRLGVNDPPPWLDQALVSNVDVPYGVAVDASHLYWASTTGAIGRANLDGSAPDRTFIEGLEAPCGLTVDAGHIYWGDLALEAIGRASLSGAEVEPEFIPGVPSPCGVAVSVDHVYWSSEEPNAIGRAGLDGGNPEPFFIPLPGRPCGVAVDAAHIYWTNSFEPGAYVSRANLDGSGADRLAGEQFYAGSCGIALDSRVFQPRSPLSLPIRFGQLKRRNKGRLLVLPVFAPERGELTLTSPRIGWRLDKGPIPPPWRYGSFRWKLELWPGKGRAGKRIRRQLRTTGRAPIDLEFTWEQLNSRPIGVTKNLAFVTPR